MSKIKMLVLDIDGTIFKKDYTASDRVKNTLQRLSDDGIKVVLCTGRMYAATKCIARSWGLQHRLFAIRADLLRILIIMIQLFSKTPWTLSLHVM
ncbi:MAG: HAD-IIB family hydrolase [Candidatus Gastranaerophilaceae bacterium]